MFLVFLTAIETGRTAKIRDFLSKEPTKWKTVVTEVCFLGGSIPIASRECYKRLFLRRKRRRSAWELLRITSTILFVFRMAPMQLVSPFCAGP